MRFNGEGAFSVQQARLARTLLKNTDNTWKQLLVQGAEDVSAPLYVLLNTDVGAHWISSVSEGKSEVSIMDGSSVPRIPSQYLIAKRRVT